jgi:hypothetical protein
MIAEVLIMKTVTSAICVMVLALVTSGFAAAQKKEAPETRKAGEHAESRPADGEEKASFTFDDGTPGALPKGFTVAETKGAGTPATWKVETLKDDAKHKNAVKVDSKNKEGVFNVLLSEKTYGPDLEISVDIKAGSGEDDQGGGLVWRAKDANNYYITRWNPLEKNIRLYKVEGGVRTMFKSADVVADPKEWHEIEVAQTGAKIVVELDDKEVLTTDDSTFKEGGKVGLWTKADASSWFDNLVIEWKK